ncbi:hypothetical protein K438DRAFT_1981954 [Mycena galopus ATCC 62051]|nr:hypothetical protein K438DRAFT_1981954 [Mycena galopus ATCC 62051]
MSTWDGVGEQVIWYGIRKIDETLELGQMDIVVARGKTRGADGVVPCRAKNFGRMDFRGHFVPRFNWAQRGSIDHNRLDLAAWSFRWDSDPVQFLYLKCRFLAGGRRTTRTVIMLGSINKEDSTFKIAVMQYISATKKHEVFLVRCLISDSSRWRKCNPVPANNELASITGFLTGVERDDDHTVKHFIDIVNVDQVVFGQSDSA